MPDETTVTEIWGQVLGIGSADPTANFFDLGGDSVAAVRICAQARQLGHQLTMADIFVQQTLGAVLALLEQRAIGKDAS